MKRGIVNQGGIWAVWKCGTARHLSGLCANGKLWVESINSLEQTAIIRENNKRQKVMLSDLERAKE